MLSFWAKAIVKTVAVTHTNALYYINITLLKYRHFSQFTILDIFTIINVRYIAAI